ncbi:hypothetical protein M231_07081 [Tremella mesenterica]|uniref:Arrestin C-terminal-like domain-containing protein n=1 Tax=Tremella mesenterica TaxID=5217 RepID=A0A4Q1BFV6_TREME|nr:hypothetical protein M231_07081 [Tremella mesenterica]
MPWYNIHHPPPSSSSTPSSRPSSRPPSPTTNLTSRSAAPTLSPPPRRDIPIDPTEPLDDYFFSSGHHQQDSLPLPVPGWQTLGTSTVGSYSAVSDMGPSISNPATPAGSIHGGDKPIEIKLDADNLVMRGYGSEMNPAYLSGRVEVNLLEATNVKDISMQMTCKARVQFVDVVGTSTRSHHYTHNLAVHDWRFLGGRQTHTMKAGRHTFPFSFALEGTLPSSVTTYNGDAFVMYRLKATLAKGGFVTHTIHAEKSFTVHRMFSADALEFTQTLEIENTWPGKVMYSISIPYKAYAAGDDIPVIVKFMPLAKGIKVSQVTTVLKEYSVIHSKHSAHSDVRVILTAKHKIVDGRAVLVSSTDDTRQPTKLPSSVTSQASSVNNSAANSRAPSRSSSPSRTPQPARAALPRFSEATPMAQPAPVIPDQPVPGPSSRPHQPPQEDAQDVEIGDDEINTSFSIIVPEYTTPTHTIHPILVQHKVKWSFSITNPDGHVSELRCALPIIILDNSLLDEAREAGANTRALLVGGLVEDGQVNDLPSYNNHVYDRIAVADSGSTTEYVPRSRHQTPHHSPQDTPPASRSPTRPSSVTRHSSYTSDSGTENPPRPALDENIDTELLLSLGALGRVYNLPPGEGSPGPIADSLPTSRRGSRIFGGSRNSSRAPSPERGVEPARQNSGLTGFLNLSQAFRHHSGSVPTKPILRNSAAPPAEGVRRNATSFTNMQMATAQPGVQHPANHVQFAGEAQPRARFHFPGAATPDEEQANPLNVVPPYAVASRGFLGGGVVPLDVGLPTYDASERQVEESRCVNPLMRPRSDTALVQLGARAAIEAEERATEEAESVQS